MALLLLLLLVYRNGLLFYFNDYIISQVADGAAADGAAVDGDEVYVYTSIPAVASFNYPLMCLLTK